VLNQATPHGHVWGSGGIVPRIIDLGTRCRWVVRFMPRPLYPPGKEPPVPNEKEAGWGPEPVWTQWPRGKIPVPTGDRTPVVYLAAKSLYRLSYRVSLWMQRYCGDGPTCGNTASRAGKIPTGKSRDPITGSEQLNDPLFRHVELKSSFIRVNKSVTCVRIATSGGFCFKICPNSGHCCQHLVG
jgi:hypothetical protein